MSAVAAGVPTAAITREHPVEELLGAMPETGGAAWVRHGEGLVGRGEAARLDPGAGRGRFARAQAGLDEVFTAMQVDDAVGLRGSGPVAFASFTFDPDAAGSRVVVPRVVVGRRGSHAWRTVVSDAGTDEGDVPDRVRLLPRRSRITYAGSSLPELSWLEAVADAAAEIAGGGVLRKVVLARDVRVVADEPLDVRVLAARLAERYAGCWTFLVDGLLGATPELLVRRTGDRVSSLVLAGTARRDADEGRDAAIGSALQRSSKDREEHALAVASVRDVLAGRCARLVVDPAPHLLRLANVQHLATRVEGVLDAPASVLELAGALHPTAAVCGTPTPVALDRIREREGMDRGRYSGPVGWTDARGDGEFGIALRCAEVTDAGARLFAGNGIVGDSLPEVELEETRLKLRAMQSALED